MSRRQTAQTEEQRQTLVKTLLDQIEGLQRALAGHEPADHRCPFVVERDQWRHQAEVNRVRAERYQQQVRTLRRTMKQQQAIIARLAPVNSEPLPPPVVDPTNGVTVVTTDS